jgi:hypothetical protein
MALKGGTGHGKILAATEDSNVAAGEFFRFLGTYYIYQDQHAWSRTQTMAIVEAGVLAGSWSADGLFAPLLLALGTGLVWGLFGTVLRAWQIRDYVAGHMQPVFDSYGFKVLPPPSWRMVRGRTMLRNTVAGIVTVNVILIAYQVVSLLSPGWLGRLQWMFGPP